MEIMSKKRFVFKRIKRFIEDCENFKDDAKLGCPSTSRKDKNIKRVRSFVFSNQRLIIRIIAN